MTIDCTRTDSSAAPYTLKLTASRVFTDLLSNSPKRSPRFLPGYEGTENMFYFLNEIYVAHFVLF